MANQTEAFKTKYLRIDLDRDMAKDVAKIMRQPNAKVAVINLINDFVLRNKNIDLWSIEAQPK